MCLLALKDTHLQIYGITHDIHFCRLQVIEQITVVPVVVAHSIVVFGESFVHQFLVIDVTLVHTQLTGKLVGRVDGIAHPCDIADVIFLTLIHLQVDIHMLGIVVPDTVFQNDGITITQLIIFVDEVLLVSLVAFRRIFFSFQERTQFAGLVNLGKGTLA